LGRQVDPIFDATDRKSENFSRNQLSSTCLFGLSGDFFYRALKKIDDFEVYVVNGGVIGDGRADEEAFDFGKVKEMK
jgi:hypothetical protein